MPWLQWTLLPIVWVCWVIYWLSGRRRLKPVERQESRRERLSHIIPMALAILLFDIHLPRSSLLSGTFLPHRLLTYWLGFGGTVLGLLFTVYARRYLGGNWSGTVTLKRDHTLTREGPYRWIRHPIYTGLIIAFLGSAVAVSTWQTLLACAIVLVTLIVKLRREERWMEERFGAAYVDYRSHTWALVPWIY